jgi:hypothetical protein
MNLKQRNTKKQGDVGMGVAIGYFASQGYTVCIPLTDSQDYDLVVDIDDKLQRVQVKTTTFRKNGPDGGYLASLRVCGHRHPKTGVYHAKDFNKKKVDYLFIVTGAGEQYFIPTTETNVRSQITVGGQAYKEFLVARHNVEEIVKSV